jgi:cation diffusion facilitator CzcD-associated flavoprotein CzcO
MAVFALDYRLAPEHPHPAALHDALAAVRALRAQGPVVLAGDSAGAGLALATALALRDAAEPAPAALLLIAPWVDLTLASLPPPAAGEAMLSRAWITACAQHYLAGADARGAAVSPLHADLHGLPPVLIQTGTDDLLHDEGLRLHAALDAAGVAVRCEVIARRWHVFQSHAGALPSADEALARAARFIGETVDPLNAAQAAAAGAAPEGHQTVILGAGMSGLCMAIRLKRAGMHDFVILEKSPGLGGTWWDNTYPGAHVDVPAPLYSFSFAANPRWTRRFASAPEIQSYMRRVAERYGVLPHIRFGSQLSEARFDEAGGHWQLATAGGQRLRARFFVCSTGPLSQARFPDIPGLADFQGTLLHSARWDPGVDLHGRRVAVIGTGSTASQLIPPIAEQAAQLHVFQRTANWVLPRLDRRYRWHDRLLAHLPPYARVVRGFWYRVLEWGRRGFDDGSLARRGMLRTAARHLQRQVPDPALREKLRPPYPLGCKRLIYSNDFLPALSQPKCELVTEPITRITPQGIVTADGRERALDALVCATGFDTVQLLSSVRVHGRGGRTLREAWSQGPEAHFGITVAGFPNLFLMLGPNTATGHTSTLLYIEPEVDYAIACMQRLLAGGERWLDVKPEVLRAHNDGLQARLRGSVWTTCSSWYRTEGGKVVALWPGFTDEYRRAISRPDFADFQFG